MHRLALVLRQIVFRGCNKVIEEGSGAAGQRDRGEIFSTLRLGVVYTIGIFVVLTATACSGSSAATQPPATVTSSSETEQDAGSAQVPTVSLETPSPIPLPTEPPPAPTPSPSPTDTPIPSPTPTPLPILRQLTTGGCCVQPFFSPDNSQVLFIDKPAETAPVGIYGVDLAAPQAEPVLVNDLIGYRNSDQTIVATLDGSEFTQLLEETTGHVWTVDTGGNRPYFSPDSSRILWTASDREGPYDERLSDVWLADLDGSNPRLLLSVQGGGFVGWLPDGRRIALITRDDPTDEQRTLFIYDIENDRRTNLFSHKRLRGTEISPEGSWIALYVTVADGEPPEKNGIWVVSTEGATQQKLDVPGFGAYRWRDDHSLIYIPMRSSVEESMQLWQVEVATNQSRPLTDPDLISFSISNGDWDVSSDGRHVIFVNSADQNIWAITLP
jgi:Tol biopolymer transport system component